MLTVTPTCSVRVKDLTGDAVDLYFGPSAPAAHEDAWIQTSPVGAGSSTSASTGTNDVYRTALKVALQLALRRLRCAMDLLANAFADKGIEFADHLKMGRTQLQDAVPMTLGQEFGSYAVMVREDADRLGEAATLIAEINLGGTAIGTGLNAHPDYAQLACTELCAVIGNDVTVTLAAEGGQLQLNAFEPIIAHSLFESLTHLTAACQVLRRRCVVGITANVEHMRATVARSIGLVTALNPHIGYEAATALAADALQSGRDIADLVLERGLLTADRLDELMRPEHLTSPLRQ